MEPRYDKPFERSILIGRHEDYDVYTLNDLFGFHEHVYIICQYGQDRYEYKLDTISNLQNYDNDDILNIGFRMYLESIHKDVVKPKINTIESDVVSNYRLVAIEATRDENRPTYNGCSCENCMDNEGDLEYWEWFRWKEVGKVGFTNPDDLSVIKILKDGCHLEGSINQIEYNYNIARPNKDVIVIENNAKSRKPVFALFKIKEKDNEA